MGYRNFESNVAIRGDSEYLVVKEEPYYNFVKLDNYICPILHNQHQFRK